MTETCRHDEVPKDLNGWGICPACQNWVKGDPIPFMADRVEATIRAWREAGAGADEITVQVFEALDRVFGGLETVVHRAGPVVADGQACPDCGATIQDYFGQEIMVAGGGPGPGHFEEGVLVGEIWRWGRASTFPRSIFVVEEEALTEPDVRRCEAPT